MAKQKGNVVTHRLSGKVGNLLVLLFLSVLSVFSQEKLKSEGKNEKPTLTLSKNGKTNYVIVTPDYPSPVELTAAKELKLHLDSVTGADFVIFKEMEIKGSKPQILVGNSKRAKQLLPGIDAAQLPYDGIVIKTVGKNLVLLGHPQRGTLYAVNTLLEDVVGVRWWTSTEASIPKQPTLKIPAQDLQYAPKLIYREAFYKDAFDGVFATRMKCNGNFDSIPAEYGGHNSFHHFVHSFYELIPPGKYFAEHPEWFSEIEGERKHARGQLCLTNDAMREELTRNALEGLRKNPDAKFISISQNDGTGGYCQCKHCAAIVEEEGSQSGPMIHFVNRVAEDIEKEFPDVWVETLAYVYTRKPPKHVKPRNNVVIRLCTYECSFVQPLDKGEQNRPMREDIESWSRIADHLFVWDYVTNFTSYMLPHPNLRVLAPNIRFFVNNNTIGLFEQGDKNCAAGDFVRLRNWIISHLMWNPALDEQKLFDEFLLGYYGAEAVPYLKKYWEALLNSATRSNVYLGIYRHTVMDWLTIEALNEAHTLIEKALSVTEDEVIRRRLQRDKMSLDYVLLMDYAKIRSMSESSGLPFAGPADPQAAVDEFFARCKQFNVTQYREVRKASETFEQDLRKQITEIINNSK
jgi:hypothetical protein